jgi:hypothetical protein
MKNIYKPVFLLALFLQSCVSEISLFYNGSVSFENGWTNFSQNKNILLIYQKFTSVPLPTVFGGCEIYIEMPKDKLKENVEYNVNIDSVKAYYILDLHHYRKPSGNIAGTFQIVKFQDDIIRARFDFNIISVDDTNKFNGEYDFKYSTDYNFFK